MQVALGGGIKPDFTWQRACTQVRRQSRLRLEEEQGATPVQQAIEKVHLGGG